jgi:hypothetical protein
MLKRRLTLIFKVDNLLRMIRQRVCGLATRSYAISMFWSAIPGQTKTFVRQNRIPLLPIALHGFFCIDEAGSTKEWRNRHNR